MVENLITYFALPVTAVSILLIFIRLVKGPTVEDRIISLDLLSIFGIAFIALYSIVSNETSFIDVGIILALLAFIGTAAFAYFIERKCRK